MRDRVRPFGGAEPLVGEVVGLRTFRVDDTGSLLPLYSPGAWYDGKNTACCEPPTGDVRRTHPVPSPDCECGFYAYGTPAAARQARQARWVLAVVSCWGEVVAGTQGFRAQHARIEAVWLHPNADRSLRSRIAGRYPSARLYDDVGEMLAAYPLSTLPSYVPAPSGARRRGALPAAGGFALLALGLLPYETIARPGLWHLWAAASTVLLALTVWLLVGARSIGHLSAALVAAGVCAWVISPWFGLYGWLLRLPLLQALVTTAARGAAVVLRPHHFPVQVTPRPRPFRGVLS